MRTKEKRKNVVRGVLFEAGLLGMHHIYKASDINNIKKKKNKNEETLVRGIFLEAGLLETHHIYKASNIKKIKKKRGKPCSWDLP
jgi:hypothetical protein